MAHTMRKRLLSILLVLTLALGTGNFTAFYVQAANMDQGAAEEQTAKVEPAVITLNTMGGTLSSAVQGGQPDSSSWRQTGTGIYQRVINSYQKLPNPVAPCYNDMVAFDGWYDSMDYTNRIEDVFVENGSMTLYAKWIYLDITGQNENMWFQYNNAASDCVVDIRGLDGDQKIMTTYKNRGYRYNYKIGSPVKPEEDVDQISLHLPATIGESIFHKVSPDYDIYVASLITIDGTYATMHYIVVNTGETDVANFSLAYTGDIMIGDDDQAIVTMCESETGDCTYIQMKERTFVDGVDTEEGKVFRLYVKGPSYGITDVDRLWIGLFNADTYKKHAFDHNTSPTQGDDSAFACSWVERTISAHSSEVFSVKLGVGELSEMENANTTVTLDANGGVFRDGGEVSRHSGSSIPMGSLEIPTRIGYQFDGWYLTREGGDRQTGSITKDTTLYAHWKEAFYDLINDTVVQSNSNLEVPKETADITIQCGEASIGRGESAKELIRLGQELELSLHVTDGYYLPNSIYVDVKDVKGTIHLTEGTGYRYLLNEDRTRATITVMPEYLTGDVVVTTIGHPLPAERPQGIEAMVQGGGESVEISLGDASPILTAVVNPEQLPDHTYEYQWYENSEASNQNGGKIPGATGQTYTFPTGRTFGDYYFYCIVTSRRNNGQIANQTSNFVKVKIKKAARTVVLEDKEEVATGEPIAIGEAEVTPEVLDSSQITYVYYTDEACTQKTAAGSPETGGSGAAVEGGAPSAIGTYYVKAYVPEDEKYEAAENTPAARLIIKSQEYQVAVKVQLDDEEWEGHGKRFALVRTDYTIITDLQRVLDGVYSVYELEDKESFNQKQDPIYGSDTGVKVTVDGQDTEAIVNYYTATFYHEGVAYGEETPQKQQIILAGQCVVRPTDPEPVLGYEFGGWMTQPDGNARFDFYAPIAQKTQIYAKWLLSERPYQVEHYLQSRTGGYVLKETERLHGTIGEERTAEAKQYAGYVEDMQHPKRVASGIVREDGALTLRLYYQLVEYAIDYELDGGRLPRGKKNPASYTVIDGEIALVNPEKDGYLFTGWTEPGSSVPQLNVTIPAGSTGERSFTATWDIVDLPYRVEHYLQAYEGGNYALAETEHFVGTVGEVKTAIAKTYVGYVENQQHSERIPTGTVTAGDSLVLKLYYAPIEYAIDYELNGGWMPLGQTNPTVYTVQNGEITLFPPMRAGYLFAGWTEPGIDEPRLTVTIPANSTGDRKFTANWTPSSETIYQVEHYLENPSGDGYSLADREIIVGMTGAAVTAEPKEYPGFVENTRYSGRVDSGTISADVPLVLRLYYDRETYVIRFVVDPSKADVRGNTVLTLRHGQAVIKPMVIPKAGYKLDTLYDGWDREVMANAEGDAVYTAQLRASGRPLKDAEKDITKADTDTSDPKGSSFYPLMLRAYGKDQAVLLKWHRIKEADGYILYGSRCGTDMKRIRTISSGKTTTCTVKKLKEGTYYKYVVVAYQNVDGKKRVTLSSKSAHAVTEGGTYGNPLAMSCNPSVVNLKKGKAKTLKPSYKETKPIKIHVSKFRFHSDNPKIATVSAKGKVKGKATGSCTIYVYAQNGFYKKVRVKVTK